MKINKTIIATIVLLIALALGINLVSAAASFSVTGFSCTPSEVAINGVFSCTATVRNNGDASGSVSTATLYPDNSNWLENSNYPQSSGTSVSAGQTAEITFTGLRATKAGNNGFSRIMLDSVTDTYVADNNVKENVINVLVTVSNSASSAAMSGTWTSSAEVTSGGNTDVVLTFTSVSGGCTITNQDSSKTISGMQDGNKQSRTWTVTQGTSGNCVFTITAAATGSGGVATKSDSVTSSITCTDCPVTSSSSSSSSAGGASGGGGGSTKSIGEINTSIQYEFGNNEKVKFSFGGIFYTILVSNVTETTAIITISGSNSFSMSVGDKKDIDLDSDGRNDINLRLKSINLISKRAILIFTPLYIPAIIGGGSGDENQQTDNEGSGSGGGTGPLIISTTALVIVSLLVIAAAIAVYYLRKKYKKHLFRRSVRLKGFKSSKF